MANTRARCEGSSGKRSENQPNINFERFESMLKLLLYMETELQLKEELLGLLLDDERIQPIINEKLAELNKREVNDPALALGRDGLYVQEAWDERFRDWHNSQLELPVDQIIRTDSHCLGANAAMRCIELAEDQLKKYTETYMTLQKAAKSYKKLKQKLAKEKNRKSKYSSSRKSSENASELIAKLQESNKLLYDKLCLERERGNKLEQQVEVINATMWRDRRKSGYIIKVLVEEVEQLSQQLQMQHKLSQAEYRNGYPVDSL